MKHTVGKELQIRLPVILAGMFLAGGAGAQITMSTPLVSTAALVSKPTTKIETKINNKELRDQLAKAAGAEFNDMAVIPKGTPASVLVMDLPEPTPFPEDMILGGSRAWFRGVQGDDRYTDNSSLSQKLRVLWTYKMKVKGVKPAVSKNMKGILNSFDSGPKTKMTLTQFVKRADWYVKDTRKHLDYKRLCARMLMDDQECDLLYDITDDLKGKDMVAYGMTELLPKQDGSKNIAILDGVLKNAGMEYLNCVPAFGDPLLSKGLYQFTSYAVRNDGTNVEGASVVNRFVEPGHQIPGSVVMLSSDDQHRAAFLFTTYNVARWIKQMSKPQMKMFKHLMPKHQEELIEYIAVSHHMPGRTIQYANAWLDRKGVDNFLAFLPSHLKTYGEKTQENYQALQAFLD